MGKWTIAKRFVFSASHQISGLCEGHPCGRLHGHNYSVTVELTSEALDHVGFVRDFGDLGAFKLVIDNELDHRHLNQVLSTNPTCENIARHLFIVARGLFPEVTAVTVSETEATWARFSE